MLGFSLTQWLPSDSVVAVPSTCSLILLSVVALTPTSTAPYTVLAVDFCAIPMPNPPKLIRTLDPQALRLVHNTINAITLIILYLYYYKTPLKSSLNTSNGQHTLHNGSHIHIGIQVLRVVTLCTSVDIIGTCHMGSTRTG